MHGETVKLQGIRRLTNQKGTFILQGAGGKVRFGRC